MAGLQMPGLQGRFGDGNDDDNQSKPHGLAKKQKRTTHLPQGLRQTSLPNIAQLLTARRPLTEPQKGIKTSVSSTSVDNQPWTSSRPHSQLKPLSHPNIIPYTFWIDIPTLQGTPTSVFVEEGRHAWVCPNVHAWGIIISSSLRRKCPGCGSTGPGLQKKAEKKEWDIHCIMNGSQAAVGSGYLVELEKTDWTPSGKMDQTRGRYWNVKAGYMYKQLCAAGFSHEVSIAHATTPFKWLDEDRRAITKSNKTAGVSSTNMHPSSDKATQERAEGFSLDDDEQDFSKYFLSNPRSTIQQTYEQQTFIRDGSGLRAFQQPFMNSNATSIIASKEQVFLPQTLEHPDIAPATAEQSSASPAWLQRLNYIESMRIIPTWLRPHLINLVLETISVLDVSGYKQANVTPAQFTAAFIAIGCRADPFDGGLRHPGGITAREVSLAQMDMDTEGGMEKFLDGKMYSVLIDIIGRERERRGQESLRDLLGRRQFD